MSLTQTWLATFTGKLTGDNVIASQSFQPKITKSIALANGTAANQADLIYVAERTVADGADDDIDLNGTLTDAFGNTVSMVEVVGIFLLNAPKTGSANTTDLTIGGGSNPFLGFLGGTTPTIGPFKPGAMFQMVSPDAAGLGTVTAGTADILRISNSAGAANKYQLVITGRSA